MALGQAHLIGLPRSNGCAYADSPRAFPIQRMPNISLAPNPERCSLDDLISGVEDGLYIVGAGSWSIDQQRDNFQFGGQLFFEIKNGALGEMVRGPPIRAARSIFGAGSTGSATPRHMNFTASSPAARRSRCNSLRSRMARPPRAFAALGFSTPTRRREKIDSDNRDQSAPIHGDPVRTASQFVSAFASVPATPHRPAMFRIIQRRAGTSIRRWMLMETQTQNNA